MPKVSVKQLLEQAPPEPAEASEVAQEVQPGFPPSPPVTVAVGGTRDSEALGPRIQTEQFIQLLANAVHASQPIHPQWQALVDSGEITDMD